MIDAGGRFAFGAVPEYMIFDKADMGAEFVEVVEEGMEKSKTVLGNKTVKSSKPAPAPLPVKEEIPFDEDPVDEDIDDIEENVIEETAATADEIRALFKEADKDTKAAVKKIIAEYGKLDDADQDGLNRMYNILNK